MPESVTSPEARNPAPVSSFAPDVTRSPASDGSPGSEKQLVNWVVGTILVAVADSSPRAQHQLTSARALARATRARVVIAHITGAAAPGTAHPLHGGDDRVRCWLQAQVAALRQVGVRADVCIRDSTEGVPAALHGIATHERADLIVIGGGQLPPTPHGVLLQLVAGAASTPYHLLVVG